MEETHALGSLSTAKSLSSTTFQCQAWLRSSKGHPSFRHLQAQLYNGTLRWTVRPQICEGFSGLVESQPEATPPPPLYPQCGVLTQIPAYFDGVSLQHILGFPWKSLKGYTITESLVTMLQATDRSAATAGEGLFLVPQ